MSLSFAYILPMAPAIDARPFPDELVSELARRGLESVPSKDSSGGGFHPGGSTRHQPHRGPFLSAPSGPPLASSLPLAAPSLQAINELPTDFLDFDRTVPPKRVSMSVPIVLPCTAYTKVRGCVYVLYGWMRVCG